MPRFSGSELSPDAPVTLQKGRGLAVWCLLADGWLGFVCLK